MERHDPRDVPANESTPGSNDAQRSRIALVDDHPIARHGLMEIIAEQPDLEACGEAGDIAEARALLASKRPNLAVIDLNLRDGDAIDLIKEMREGGLPTRVLVSSARGESSWAERALRAGAWGFISKAESCGQILEAIRQVLRGRLHLNEMLTEQLLRREVSGSADHSNSALNTLSSRELVVFGLIGQGLGTREIAESLCIDMKTIETHREHIKAKLGISSTAEMVKQAVESQFVQERDKTRRTTT